MAGLCLRADLAIGAAGTSSWERAALALPSLLSSVVDNQRHVADVVTSCGGGISIQLDQPFDIVERNFIKAISTLINQPERLEALSESARLICDGRGLERIFLAMFGPSTLLHLRPTTYLDEGLYFQWSNEHEVRTQSFCSDPIPLADHKRWFRDRLNSSDTLLRVLVDEQGLPLGQIRFDRSLPFENRVTISFSLDPAARGFGLAIVLLNLGMKELAKVWGSSIEFYGEVRASNEASINTFVRAGFTEGRHISPEVRCFMRCGASEI